MYRSHTDKVILLIQIQDKFVPIAENGVEIVFQVMTEGYDYIKLKDDLNKFPLEKSPDF